MVICGLDRFLFLHRFSYIFTVIIPFITPSYCQPFVNMSGQSPQNSNTMAIIVIRSEVRTSHSGVNAGPSKGHQFGIALFQLARSYNFSRVVNFLS